MPSAPPSSALVSERAEAEPARSGGAAPRTMSVTRVTDGERPIENITDATTIVPTPEETPTRVSTQNPAAARTRPAAISGAGRNRRARTGVTSEPRMNPNDHGSVQSPDSSGERPSTICRYWATKMKAPNATKSARV